MKISKHYCPDSLFGYRYEIEIAGRVITLFRGIKPTQRRVVKHPTIRKKIWVSDKVYIWSNAVAGKTMNELRIYVENKGVILSPEDLQTVYNYANNIVKQ